MLLAYVAFSENGNDYSKLCLIPAEDQGHCIPVRLDTIEQTDAAVFHIGVREAVNCVIDEREGSKVLWPIPPATIFLTPDNPQRPGIRAFKIKVTYLQNGAYEVSYTKELSDTDKWTVWKPKQVR